LVRRRSTRDALGRPAARLARGLVVLASRNEAGVLETRCAGVVPGHHDFGVRVVLKAVILVLRDEHRLTRAELHRIVAYVGDARSGDEVLDLLCVRVAVRLMASAWWEQRDSEHRLCGPDAVLGDQPSHIHVDPSPLWYSSTRLRTLHGHLVRVLVHGPVHSVLPLSLTAFDATVRNGAHVGQQAQSEQGSRTSLMHRGSVVPSVQLYDAIGTTYSATRRTEPRIAAQVWAALGDARTVLNVGAGTGSYEPADREVTAVEPSAVMRAQRPEGAAPCVAATAESLPFEDQSFDAAMAFATVHHWQDPIAGLREMQRVARRVVVFTCETTERSWRRRFWLTRDYLHEV